MLSSHRTLLRQKDDLFEVIEVFSSDYFFDDKNELKRELFDWWKRVLSADTALKNESKFFFCKKIEELEFEMISTELILASEA